MRKPRRQAGERPLAQACGDEGTITVLAATGARLWPRRAGDEGLPWPETTRWTSVIVLVLTAVPPGLRGDLTRWLMEVSPGIFTGKASRRVREHLWARVRLSSGSGSAVMVVATASAEQGDEILTAGHDRWTPQDSTSSP